MIRIVVTNIQHSFVRNIACASNNITSCMGLEYNSNYSSRIAVVIDEGISLSYGDLAASVGSYVSLLSSKYSLSRGDRLLVKAEKSINILALYLATLRLGAIYVPIIPTYTSRETMYFDLEPRIFVTSDLNKDCIFINSTPYVVDLSMMARDASKYSPDYGMENVLPDDTACICYTSGTTGKPKGAMITHKGLKWNAESLIDLWRFVGSDVLLHQLPFYHVHGMFISLNCSLLTKSCIIWRPSFTVEDALKWLPMSTVMMGVPTYYSRLLKNQEFNVEVTRNIRLFVSGSAPLSSSLAADFHSRTGSVILERYGMTEAAVITSNAYDQNSRLVGSVGKILKGGEMRLSKTGVLEIRLPSLFSGYWRNPMKTQESFTDDGFFITGDIGRIDNEGNLWILGREKDMIISGGLNVSPKEVEDIVDSFPFVSESAVIGIPHSDYGEAVVAICVKESNSTIVDSRSILEQLKSQLASYKIPKRIIFLDCLPKNSMGKVQKNLLREKYKDLFISNN